MSRSIESASGDRCFCFSGGSRIGSKEPRQIYPVKGPIPEPIAEFAKQRERMRRDLTSG